MSLTIDEDTRTLTLLEQDQPPRTLRTPNVKRTRQALLHPHRSLGHTPQVLSDDNQAIVWQAGYMPFGEATLTKENVTFNLRFPGQYFDSETGLHYNYFRDYDPSIGRYIESDPIGLAGGINTYAYVDSNPLSFSDPFGESKLVFNRRYKSASIR